MGRGIAECALVAVEEAKERAEALAAEHELLEQQEEEQKVAAGEACAAKMEGEE